MSQQKQRYAAGTSVSVGRSKEEIEGELRRLGATRHAMMVDAEALQAMVVFEREGVRYRITLPQPDPRARQYLYMPERGARRELGRAEQLWRQDVAERWRALALYIKNLRVAVEAGIVKVEEALPAHVVLPNDQTVGQWAWEQIPAVYAGGSMPPLLPGGQPPTGGATIRQLPNPEEE